MADAFLDRALKVVINIRNHSKEEILDKSQCSYLAEQLVATISDLQIISASLSGKCDKVGRIWLELHRIIYKSENLVKNCSSEKWIQTALIQIDNKQEFLDLLVDLRCCVDSLREQTENAIREGKLDAVDLQWPRSFSKVALDACHLNDQQSLLSRVEDLTKHETECSADYVANKGFLAKYLLGRLASIRQANPSKITGLDELIPNYCWSDEVYKQEKRIGHGSSGTVFKTFWFGEHYAEKVLTLEIEFQEGKSTFQREAEILARLCHPNIISFMSFRIDPERRECLILMELMEMSLQKLIEDLIDAHDGVTFSLPVAVDIMLQIANGMCYLHNDENKIVHRDLKPGNILVKRLSTKDRVNGEEYVQVKIADFGLAKTKKIHMSSTLGMNDRGVGTTMYRAPEVFHSHSSRRINAFKADVYSFAVTCAIILSGRLPYAIPFSDLHDRITRKGERPELPAHICPPELASLINECWSIDPLKRPSFLDICARLRSFRVHLLGGVHETYHAHSSKSFWHRWIGEKSPGQTPTQKPPHRGFTFSPKHGAANTPHETSKDQESQPGPATHVPEDPTRWTGEKSFRVEGMETDTTIDELLKRIGVPALEGLAIQRVDWEARKIQSRPVSPLMNQPRFPLYMSTCSSHFSQNQNNLVLKPPTQSSPTKLSKQRIGQQVNLRKSPPPPVRFTSHFKKLPPPPVVTSHLNLLPSNPVPSSSHMKITSSSPSRSLPNAMIEESLATASKSVEARWANPSRDIGTDFLPMGVNISPQAVAVCSESAESSAGKEHHHRVPKHGHKDVDVQMTGSILMEKSGKQKIATSPSMLPKNLPWSSWRKGGLLGSGSFGNVYEGIGSDGTFFAVKEVLTDAKQAISQLEQEILLLSEIKHTNIVKYLGTERRDDKLYIFLELVSKGSLASVYKQYEFHNDQIRYYTTQILFGLKYLHDRNIIHRDIKCANILVETNGVIKLADFGMAKEVFNKSDKLKSCKGSVYWMAPEVIDPKQTYNLAADIWSVGCTVLEMATREPPFGALEWQNVFWKVGNGEVPPIPEDLPTDLRDFIHACLKVNSAERPSCDMLLMHPFVSARRFSESLSIEVPIELPPIAEERCGELTISKRLDLQIVN